MCFLLNSPKSGFTPYPFQSTSITIAGMKRFIIAAIVGLGVAATVSAQTILLDDFSDAVGAGIVPGSTWATTGNVVFNGTTITVGNTAKNDNGWGIENTLIDAHLMHYITIVAHTE